MSILRTIAMFIYLFGYMILHYGIPVSYTHLRAHET